MGKDISFYFKPGDILYIEVDPNEDLKYIEVRGSQDIINQFLVQEASETEKMLNHFNTNYQKIQSLYKIFTKEYKAEVSKKCLMLHKELNSKAQ